VAYTLIRNPSIQQYTAKNLQLLENEKKAAHVFTLRHTIKGVKEGTQGAVKDSFTEEIEKEVDIGIEITELVGGDEAISVEEEGVGIDMEFEEEGEYGYEELSGKQHQD
jgi:nitrate/nitrite-specific signal transduction histidine kinase